MSKHIQAYFKSEDQAEGARTSLLPYETEQLEVGALDRSIGRNSNILVPLLPLNGSGVDTGGTYGSVGVPGTVSAQGVVPVVAMAGRTDDNEPVSGERERAQGDVPGSGPVVDVTRTDEGDYDDLKYVLTAKVRDNDYDDIVRKLRMQGAYVEHLD
ncbi:hypothetical protein [Paenibacillus sp. A14]|uniref:hypothetical protein n=1 Tax=Paenibacillus sp. A14 TaxID=3119820 RepID=UPI002FE1C075